jgi:hypothetical protein
MQTRHRGRGKIRRGAKKNRRVASRGHCAALKWNFGWRGAGFAVAVIGPILESGSVDPGRLCEQKKSAFVVQFRATKSINSSLV